MRELKISQYEGIKRQLIKTKEPFVVKSTSYTKQLKVRKATYLFSDTPTSPEQLKLINLARKDGLKFINEKKQKKIKSVDIEFYKFYDNFSENTKVKGYKIDLTSAYWVCAINEGIISQETNNFFKKCKLDKHARLKALGSFATKKQVQKYDNGKLIFEEGLIFNENLRNLYLYI